MMHGEKTEKRKGTHRSRTSPLPGSPLGTEAAFSITAATTLPASMLPPDGTSPLWRNVSGREGRAGEGRGGREGDRDESKPPPDVKPAGGCSQRHSRLSAHRDAPLSGMTSSQSDAGDSCNSFYLSLDSKAAPESGNKNKCIYF